MQATLHRRFLDLNLDLFARLRLKNFYFRPTDSDLFLEPGACLWVAVAEDQCARLHLADQFQQRLAVGVRGEVEVAHVAALSQVACAVAEMKGLPSRRRLEPAARCLGIGVADEEDAVFRLRDHTLGQLIGGGVLGEHAGGHHEQAPLVELDRGRMVAIKHGQVQRLVEL